MKGQLYLECSKQGAQGEGSLPATYRGSTFQAVRKVCTKVQDVKQCDWLESGTVVLKGWEVWGCG